MIILKRKLTLTEGHKRIASIFEDTVLDSTLTNLWFHYRPAKVFVDGRDVAGVWNIWRDFDLKVGQEITIEVRN